MLDFLAKIFLHLATLILMLKARFKDIECVYKIDILDAGFDIKVRFVDEIKKEKK